MQNKSLFWAELNFAVRSNMQTDAVWNTLSPHVCLCPCLSLRPVRLRVGGCVSTCPPGGEVSVKWVLFSPVGWVRSLQIRTACHRDCSHRRCRRCSRLQRRVGARCRGRASLPPRANPSPARTLSRRALGPQGCCWAGFSAGLLPRPCPARNPPAQTLPSLLFLGPSGSDPGFPLPHHQRPFPFYRLNSEIFSYCF